MLKKKKVFYGFIKPSVALVMKAGTSSGLLTCKLFWFLKMGVQSWSGMDTKYPTCFSMTELPLFQVLHSLKSGVLEQ